VTRRATVATIAVLVVAVVVVVVVAAVGRGGTSGTAATGATGHPPLVSSSTTATRSLVVLPMGDLSDPSNTFWELFVRPAGATGWKLATPPGIADNGGLAVGDSPAGPLVAAFLPSADLTFSVLARSTDGAASWNPDSVPGVVADAPDAVTTDGGGAVRAVLSRPRPSVVTEQDDASVWTPVAGLPAVSRTVSGCTISSYTAVATDASGVVVGAQCTDSARVGLLVSDGAGGWSPAGPVVRGWGVGTTQVLRLEAGTDAVTALAEGTSSTGSSLVAAWATGTPGDRFSASPRLAVPPGWSVLASSTGGGNGQAVTVLLGTGSGAGSGSGAGGGAARRVVSVAGPGAGWTTLAAPPSGTSAVAALGSEVDAFVPAGSRLGVWSLTSGSSAWQRVAGLTVPIQYGSSS
jgi:hypothetical protein